MLTIACYFTYSMCLRVHRIWCIWYLTKWKNDSSEFKYSISVNMYIHFLWVSQQPRIMGFLFVPYYVHLPYTVSLLIIWVFLLVPTTILTVTLFCCANLQTIRLILLDVYQILVLRFIIGLATGAKKAYVKTRRNHMYFFSFTIFSKFLELLSKLIFMKLFDNIRNFFPLL